MARTFAQIVARHTKSASEKSREPPPKILARDRIVRAHPYMAPPLASIPNGLSHATKIRLLARGMAEKNGKSPFVPMTIDRVQRVRKVSAPESAPRVIDEPPLEVAPETTESEPPVKSGGWLVMTLNILATIFIVVVVIGIFRFYVK